ncbi:hypothetical protein BpHYR1_042227 [Brachionus plicatilis]|uniref:Uncharacterized protein n=1 Tax=Brachionus plicatilis TaxID=10195 RepID=A0A3M7SGS7_BRAPC|nr:hypothetical protein BpHYR1_042227 [Brachionus plicatilis]
MTRKSPNHFSLLDMIYTQDKKKFTFPGSASGLKLTPDILSSEYSDKIFELVDEVSRANFEFEVPATVGDTSVQ